MLTVAEWMKEVARLEAFFDTANVPKRIERLDGYLTIDDVPRNIRHWLACAKAKPGNFWYETNIIHLQKVERYIRQQPGDTPA